MSGIKVEPLIYFPHLFVVGPIGIFFFLSFLLHFVRACDAIRRDSSVCLPPPPPPHLRDLGFTLRGIWTFSLFGRKISSYPVSHLIAWNVGAIKRPILERLPLAKPG